MHYRKKVISMQIIVRLLSSEDSTLLPPPSSCLRKFWVHFFLQKEGTNQMVMRYKIGTQPDSKSLRNLPTMPNKIWKYPPRGGGDTEMFLNITNITIMFMLYRKKIISMQVHVIVRVLSSGDWTLPPWVRGGGTGHSQHD